jgi:uncharacterized protein YkwD
MKHRTHKLAAKTVAAILCAALMLTACGSKETTSNETASTETTSVTATETNSVESTEMTTTEATVEPTEAPTETAPAESPAPAAEPTTAPVESTAVSTGYTYSELNQTMYAKSAVNVRDLPSTDGKKIGSLKASQEITVTGKCDQTGWYRFELNNTTGYVSDKYIVSEKPAVNIVATNNTTAGNSNTAGNTTQQNTAAPAATPAQTTTTTVSGTEEYFDRAMAEQVFALVNNDRVANGLNALAWNEDLYNIAVQRCYENDVHAGMRAGTSENYASGPTDANRFHEGWHDSTGHYNNYMNASWTDSAVAIRVVPLLGGALGYDTIAYQVFQSNGSTQSVTINAPAQDDSVAAAPKTADEDTSASSSNVGWSMTPPTQEDGLKKWQEQNPDVEVSFGN